MFVVFDIETTGLSEITCDIVEFAYILFDDNNNYVRGEQLYYYYEGMHWSEEAYAVHKISLDFLKTQADKFKENVIKMYSVLNHANVIGHNSKAFDCPFCATWLMRRGVRGLQYGIIQDTMLAWRPVYKKSRIKLTKLIDFIGVDHDTINMLVPVWFENAKSSQAHEAGYDVVATALLALRGIERGLITFEPFVKLNTSVSSDELDGMYATSTMQPDPNKYIVKLVDYAERGQSEDFYYHFVNHDYSKYASEMPMENEISKYLAEGRLFPIYLEETGVASKVFEAVSNGITYQLIVKDKDSNEGELLTMSTEYGTFTEKDVDIKTIIKNNF